MRIAQVIPLFVVGTVAACGGGGGDSGGTTNPPPPATVSSVSLTRTSVLLKPTETTIITASPKDASGNALSGSRRNVDRVTGDGRGEHHAKRSLGDDQRHRKRDGDRDRQLGFEDRGRTRDGYLFDPHDRGHRGRSERQRLHAQRRGHSLWRHSDVLVERRDAQRHLADDARLGGEYPRQIDGERARDAESGGYVQLSLHDPSRHGRNDHGALIGDR